MNICNREYFQSELPASTKQNLRTSNYKTFEGELEILQGFISNTSYSNSNDSLHGYQAGSQMLLLVEPAYLEKKGLTSIPIYAISPYVSL